MRSIALTIKMIAVIVITLSSGCSSQQSSYSETWIKMFGDDKPFYPICIRQTSDEGYATVGRIEQKEHGISNNILLMKLDSKGNTKWERIYGDDDYQDANTVRETSDGGFIIIGYENPNKFDTWASI